MNKEKEDFEKEVYSKKHIKVNQYSDYSLEKFEEVILKNNINNSPFSKKSRYKNKRIKKVMTTRELSIEEKKKLLKLNIQYGNKWLKLCSFFVNINEKNLKNQFFSLIRKGLRNACRLIGIRKNTEFVTQIKTKCLSEFITFEVVINLNEKNNVKDKKVNFIKINFHHFIKRFAFYEFWDIQSKCEKIDFLIIRKSLEYLIDLNFHRQIQKKKNFHLKPKLLNQKKFLIEELNLGELFINNQKNFLRNNSKEASKSIIKKIKNSSNKLNHNHIANEKKVNKNSKFKKSHILQISKNFSLIIQKCKGKSILNVNNCYITSKISYIIIFN